MMNIRILAAAGLVAAAACSEGAARPAAETAAATPPAPAVVEIRASDFAFAAPAEIAAGLTTLRVVNDGPELHHAQLVRFDGGHTLQDYLDAVGTGNLTPAWAHLVGGPNVPVPGGQADATLELTPGNYALVCWVHSPDGIPHVAKGMSRAIVVRPAADGAVAAQAPAADVRMTLVDYAYEMDKPIAAGRRVIHVENQAEQPHEVIIVQLAPGKTAQDVLAHLHAPQGPPPGAPVGGVTFLAKGQSNLVTADFAPGRYALLCLVPDAKDGQPHVAHGMVHEFDVA